MPCGDINEHYCQEHVYAQFLCYVISRIERGDAWADILSGNPHLNGWVEDHKIEDRKRLEREDRDQIVRDAKKSALGKLTQEERALLGFNEAV